MLSDGDEETFYADDDSDDDSFEVIESETEEEILEDSDVQEGNPLPVPAPAPVPAKRKRTDHNNAEKIEWRTSKR